MKDIQGTRIDKLGFYPQKLGDLIYFEGPLLSLFIDKNKPDTYYLYKWADNDETSNRWIITPIDSSVLRSFFKKEVSLKEIILNNPICYCIDLDGDLTERVIYVCSSTDLPEGYLPSEDSFYKEESYTEFAQTFKTIITNNRLYDLMYGILNELVVIKRTQAKYNSLIDVIFSGKFMNPSSLTKPTVYRKSLSIYENIFNE